MAIDSFIGENRIGTTKTYYKNGNTKSIGYCILLSREKTRVRTKDSIPYVEDVCTNCLDMWANCSVIPNRPVISASGPYSVPKHFVDEWYENGEYKVKHRTYYTDGLLLMVESQYDSHGCINHIKLYQWLDNKYIREFGRIWSGWKLLN